MSFEGKIALVTGASRGIGRAIAETLVARGAKVIGTATSESGAQAISDYLGANGKGLMLNVTDPASIESVLENVRAEFGEVDILVNNAGILFEQSTVENLTAERINRVLATNVTGYFLCCREAVKRMSFKHGGQGGSIVNVSSAASRLGAPFEYVDYAASKGAVDTLTTGLALEVAAQGIRVNCVRPGLIYTEMHASGGEPGRVDRVKSLLPMQRGGQPEEVAQAITWLLSEKASYVTGSFLELAGGK